MKKRPYICSIGDTLKIYHVGPKPYEDIRPLAFQKDNEEAVALTKEIIGEVAFETYQYEVSAFIEPITPELIKKLVDNGFERWKADVLYEHTINLDANVSAINYINITSHPEQQAFMDKHWLKWYDEHKDLDSDAFNKARQALKRQMSKETGIPMNMSLKEFKNVLRKRIWCNMEYYVNLNVEKGSKRQYASYIPHVQISVNKPLIVENVVKIDED